MPYRSSRAGRASYTTNRLLFRPVPSHSEAGVFARNEARYHAAALCLLAVSCFEID